TEVVGFPPCPHQLLETAAGVGICDVVDLVEGDEAVIHVGHPPGWPVTRWVRAIVWPAHQWAPCERVLIPEPVSRSRRHRLRVHPTGPWGRCGSRPTSRRRVRP